MPLAARLQCQSTNGWPGSSAASPRPAATDEAPAQSTPSEFDPYHTWLGIPKEEQPPSHYRLLGIKPFEDSPDVIEHAADRQMIYIRTLAAGKRERLSQKILNELSAAKICLLDAGKKRAYDTTLRKKKELAASGLKSGSARPGPLPMGPPELDSRWKRVAPPATEVLKRRKAAYNSGLTHFEKGEFDKAIADFSEAIRLDPKDALAYYNRGKAYVRKGEYDKAIADYSDAFRLDPQQGITDSEIMEALRDAISGSGL